MGKCILGFKNENSLIAGHPAKIVKDVSDEMIAWKTEGTKLYQALPGEMHSGWEVCEPLPEVEADRPSQDVLYRTWNESNIDK